MGAHEVSRPAGASRCTATPNIFASFPTNCGHTVERRSAGGVAHGRDAGRATGGSAYEATALAG